MSTSPNFYSLFGFISIRFFQDKTTKFNYWFRTKTAKRQITFFSEFPVKFVKQAFKKPLYHFASAEIKFL